MNLTYRSGIPFQWFFWSMFFFFHRVSLSESPQVSFFFPLFPLFPRSPYFRGSIRWWRRTRNDARSSADRLNFEGKSRQSLTSFALSSVKDDPTTHFVRKETFFPSRQQSQEKRRSIFRGEKVYSQLFRDPASDTIEAGVHSLKHHWPSCLLSTSKTR